MLSRADHVSARRRHRRCRKPGDATPSQPLQTAELAAAELDSSNARVGDEPARDDGAGFPDKAAVQTREGKVVAGSLTLVSPGVAAGPVLLAAGQGNGDGEAPANVSLDRKCLVGDSPSEIETGVDGGKREAFVAGGACSKHKEACCAQDDEEGGAATRTSPIPFERRLLNTLVTPTGAQSSLVGDELLLLRGLRTAAAEHLSLDFEAKTLFSRWSCGGDGGDGGVAVEGGMEGERGESEAT